MVADTWIHLSYAVLGGERNRALTIVKARGTWHSNQVRELILSSQGISLTEVYTAGGEVLMGTRRWEKEAEVKREQERIRLNLQSKQRDLELAETEAQAKSGALQRELEARRVELEILQQEQVALEQQWLGNVKEVRSLRSSKPAQSGEGEAEK